MEAVRIIHLPSSVKTARSCPRQWRFKQQAGAEETNDALDLGTRLHKQREAYLLHGTMPTNAIARAGLEHLPPAGSADGGNAFDVLVEHAWEMVFDLPNGRVEMPGTIDLLDLRHQEPVVNDHKCLIGSTRVFDHAVGQWRTLQEVEASGNGCILTAMSVEGTFVEAAARVSHAGVRPTRILRTKGGREIGASYNHPFWTHRGWVDAQDLHVGDWLATPRAQPSSTRGCALSDEALRLVGYMIGDGCFANMQFTKTDAAVLADVERCARAIGAPCVWQKPSRGKHSPVLRLGLGGVMSRLLDHVGVAGKAADKRVPQLVGLSDAQCGQLLGALWSTDGCVCLRKCGTPRMVYTSVSKRLCQDVQELLQRLGIVASVTTSSVLYKGERRPTYNTTIITRASKRRFLELVETAYIPVVRMAALLSEVLAALPDVVHGNGSDSRCQPKDTPGIWWDRIVTAEPGPTVPVFDVEVPGPHTFVANGLVTHNSCADIDKWALTPGELAADPQLNCYAHYVLTKLTPQAPRIRLVHHYMQTRGEPRGEPREVVVTRESVEGHMAGILHTVNSMLAWLKMEPEAVQGNPYACGNYGGCFARADCSIGCGEGLC